MEIALEPDKQRHVDHGGVADSQQRSGQFNLRGLRADSVGDCCWHRAAHSVSAYIVLSVCL